MARERKNVKVFSSLSDQELVDRINDINRRKAQDAEDIRLGRVKYGLAGSPIQTLSTRDAEAEIERRKKAGTWMLDGGTSADVSPAPAPSQTSAAASQTSPTASRKNIGT